MRPTQFSTETLRTFLKEKHIATMKQLKKALNTNIDMTIYRKLKQLSYHTSYSHKGKFYTLDEIATFNEKGLWKYDIARFSKYGTLMETVKAFIEQSPHGYTLPELREQLGVEVKEPLLLLFNRARINREYIAGRYVYFSSNAQQCRHQHLMRLESKPSFTTAETDVVLAHEVRAAIILFFSFLDEQQRRLYAGLESLRIGHGGDSIISRLLDIDSHTVARGRKQLLKRDIVIERVRRKGGGRTAIKKNSPDN
jgi:hypothetical protein